MESRCEPSYCGSEDIRPRTRLIRGKIERIAPHPMPAIAVFSGGDEKKAARLTAVIKQPAKTNIRSPNAFARGRKCKPTTMPIRAMIKLGCRSRKQVSRTAEIPTPSAMTPTRNAFLSNVRAVLVSIKRPLAATSIAASIRAAHILGDIVRTAPSPEASQQKLEAAGIRIHPLKLEQPGSFEVAKCSRSLQRVSCMYFLPFFHTIDIAHSPSR